MLIKGADFKIPEYGSMPMQYRPVIIGSGPAGLFAGLFLARGLSTDHSGTWYGS